MTCAEKREIFFLEAGCLQFGRGELGWGIRRGNRRGEVGRVVIYSLLPKESPTKLVRRWLRQQFWRWIGHVIVRRSRFESLGDSVNKITCKKLHVSDPYFFKNLNISSVISSVYNDRCIPSVDTDQITDGIVSVGNYHRKLPIELFRR